MPNSIDATGDVKSQLPSLQESLSVLTPLLFVSESGNGHGPKSLDGYSFTFARNEFVSFPGARNSPNLSALQPNTHIDRKKD